MSEHVLEWLGAYLDGELHDGQIHKVEAHLQKCQVCQEELRSLGALSAGLQAAPLPDFPAPERFAMDVALLLPREPVKPNSRKALEFGWWMAPVGLILAWIFFSTTLLVSNAVTAANGLGLFGGAPAWLVSATGVGAYWSGALGQFGLLSGNGLQWAELMEALTRTTVPLILWQVSIALLYLSWMAIWWARQSRHRLGEPFDSGSHPTIS
jgi:anti-sigma factor RsiW